MPVTRASTTPLGLDSDLTVSALGFGCWAIGGLFDTPDRAAAGWGEVDDAESIAAIRRGLELGVTFFDTADVYGTGHSEEVLGRALAGERDGVVLATKFGNTFREGTGEMTGQDLTPAYIRRACEASLRRLATDRIDLYQCHVGDLEPAVAAEVIATLEQLAHGGPDQGVRHQRRRSRGRPPVGRSRGLRRLPVPCSTCSRTRPGCWRCARATGSPRSRAPRSRWAC